ncbi:MAG: hypothetical protein IPL33_16720 [Sphingobacteriales bacterium]|nr:hypothetical protein [Sphingobacteriales bacterium]
MRRHIFGNVSDIETGCATTATGQAGHHRHIWQYGSCYLAAAAELRQA